MWRALAGRLSSEVVKALADEASGPRGAFLPLPIDGQDPSIETLKSDIRSAAGKMLTAEGGDWDVADNNRGHVGTEAVWS